MGICQWTDEETDDNVLGSGAFQWEWWLEYYATEAGYVLTIEDPKDSKKSITKAVSRAKVRSVVTEIMLGQHDVASYIVRYFKDDDPDADAMDAALQIAVLGESAFG